MTLRREGELWKVDRYEDDLLHALYDRYLFDQLKLTASEPGLNEAGAASCVEDRIKTIGAARFRGFAYAVIGNRDEAAGGHDGPDRRLPLGPAQRTRRTLLPAAAARA